MDEMMDIMVDEKDELTEVGAPATDELAVMREELEALRGEIVKRDAEAAERALFEALYPGMKREDIPACVFEEAEARGIPLAAALALHDRRMALEGERVGTVNQENRLRSTGGLSRNGGVSHSFTLEEIRAMTPAQVKRHYRQIIASLGGQ